MNGAELYEMEIYSAKRCAVYFADRCKLLEQLCSDLWMCAKDSRYCEPTLYERMNRLGLLEDINNVKPMD